MLRIIACVQNGFIVNYAFVVTIEGNVHGVLVRKITNWSPLTVSKFITKNRGLDQLPGRITSAVY